MSDAPAILVVDDEDSVRELLSRWLEASGYAVMPARSAEEALSRLETSPTAVALCDIRMPGHDGLWLAARIRQRFPQTAVIMATGVQDVEASIESMRQGVLDYLTKPFGRDRLQDAVVRGIEWHHAAWDARRWRETLDREMDVLKARLSDSLRRLTVSAGCELEALLPSLLGCAGVAHARRVSELSLRTGRLLGMAEPDLERLSRAALLHDIGKLVLPDAILRKPAPLTTDEQALVRTCPALAADLLARVPLLAGCAPVVRDVHERMDGHGYPRRLRAAEVRLESRIIAVADAFDTMTHTRVFRDALSRSEARLELARCAGTQFDPDVVTALERVVAACERAAEAPADRR